MIQIPFSKLPLLLEHPSLAGLYHKQGAFPRSELPSVMATIKAASRAVSKAGKPIMSQELLQLIQILKVM